MYLTGNPYIDQILTSWHAQPKEQTYFMIRKYGFPQEAIFSRLIWYNNGPWKRTIIYRDPVPHNFPTLIRIFLSRPLIIGLL